jgi:hypothetical protein
LGQKSNLSSHLFEMEPSQFKVGDELTREDIRSGLWKREVRPWVTDIFSERSTIYQRAIITKQMSQEQIRSSLVIRLAREASDR